jgi:hypothetical protein
MYRQNKAKYDDAMRAYKQSGLCTAVGSTKASPPALLDTVDQPLQTGQVSTPSCGCGIAALRAVVQRDTPNKGREYFHCATRTCGFFSWADGKGGKSEPKEAANAKENDKTSLSNCNKENDKNSLNSGCKPSEISAKRIGELQRAIGERTARLNAILNDEVVAEPTAAQCLLTEIAAFKAEQKRLSAS